MPKKLLSYFMCGSNTLVFRVYMALLVRLEKEIAKKRPEMKKKVFFHQDNAPCHKSISTMTKLFELHFKLLPHPLYSPDLYFFKSYCQLDFSQILCKIGLSSYFLSPFHLIFIYSSNKFFFLKIK